MSTFLFSAIANGSVIFFDPARDVLSFDVPSISAADLTLIGRPDGSGVTVATPSSTFTLAGSSLSALDGSNIVFWDGSLLVNASNADPASVSFGSAHDDLLMAAPGLPLTLGSRSSDGKPTSDSYADHLSSDGRYLFFTSLDGKVTSARENPSEDDDVFMKDLLTGSVSRISLGPGATDGYAQSRNASASADGSRVAFESDAINLVPNDTNGAFDVFVKDLQTGSLTRVSTSSIGAQATGGASSGASISADGRLVAFTSAATNLVVGDTNATQDVFVKDLQTGLTTRVSTSSTGAQGNAGQFNAGSRDAHLSADGRFVVFNSASSNLVANDTNNSSDLFVKNLATGALVAASTDVNGTHVSAFIGGAAISADGRVVAFSSSGSLLYDGLDGNGSIYVRDMVSGTLTRVTGASSSTDENNRAPALSGDGRFIVFATRGPVTVGDDTEASGMFVKDLQTGRIAQLADDGAGESSMRPVISADGSTISFVSNGNLLTGVTGSQAYAIANPLDTRALAGGAGDDKYVVSHTLDQVIESAGQGNDTVFSSVSYTLPDNVEHLVLTGNEPISATGNALANALTGNTAANTLDGGAGGDTMAGGAGNDIYRVDNSADMVIESAGGGVDTVISTVTLTLATAVENLTLAGTANINGTGTGSANVIQGNAGNNKLYGGLGTDTASYANATAAVTVSLAITSAQDTRGAGVDLLANFENLTGSNFADVLTGSGLANVIDGGYGADTMAGGSGDDTYLVNDGADRTIESWGGGIDTVRSAVSWTLAADTENLTLLGSSTLNGTGNTLDNLLLGNSANNTLDGGAGSDTLDGGVGVDRLTGGNGSDTYFVDNKFDVVTELAGQGVDTVQSSVDWTLGANLENLTLTGSSAVYAIGTNSANLLVGNNANNTFNGGGGADTMRGGLGDDSYIVDNVADIVIELSGEGNDTLITSFTSVLAVDLENLELTGAAAINATGNAANNKLTGNSGKNRLDGSAGADTMKGAAGDDTYVVDNIADQITELAGGGIDRVESSVSLTLGAEQEHLLLTGLAAIDGRGNGLNNQITGNAAANLLDGGLGSDTLTGGAGNDTYIVSGSGDQLIELTGGGVDSVQSDASWTLGAELENLLLTGSAVITATGNALANQLTGNAAANALDGGLGADTLTGGAGDDLYVIDNTADRTVELAAGGVDTVQASVSWTLAVETEHLSLTGTTALSGTGNALANRIIGNVAANVLNGADGADTIDGGAGADTLAGGTGNDLFFVDNAGDKITELAGGGIDTVQSSISWTLAAELENLVLTNTDFRTPQSGTGNALNNVITGSLEAENTLDGGLGADTLVGGNAFDIYIVDNVGDKIDLTNEWTYKFDSVRSSVTWTLAAGLRNLTLTGTAAIDGTGNDLDNAIIGNAGNNVLDGQGGQDWLAGGAGDDTYVIADYSPTVVELAGEGIDTIRSSVDCYLSYHENVENVTLTGTATYAYGNELDNLLIGNALANKLGGGRGTDTLRGGEGNDEYQVSDARSVLIELAGGGIDTVVASIDWTLGAELENLELPDDFVLMRNLNGTGNALHNQITAGMVDNVLDGGLGADTLTGGLGNDSYIVDNAGDRTIEAAGGGNDSVRSSISWTLAAELENLTLTGTAALSGTGNGLVNTLVGNSGANVLTGSLGADRLTGGAGADVFVLSDLLSSDTITDFAASIDKLRISQAGIRVGDGDAFVEGGSVVAGPNGFAASAEWTIVTHDIAGALTTASAAGAIGSASGAYTVGQTALFMVDNGSDSALYHFKAADANATVSAAELTLLTTLTGITATSLADLVFTP